MRHTVNMGPQSQGEHTRFNFEGVIFLKDSGIGNFRDGERARDTHTLHLGNEVQNFCTYCFVNWFHYFSYFV
jgi:hypothetical protein